MEDLEREGVGRENVGEEVDGSRERGKEKGDTEMGLDIYFEWKWGKEKVPSPYIMRLYVMHTNWCGF